MLVSLVRYNRFSFYLFADHVKTTGHKIKWDHCLTFLASSKTDYLCKIKERLLIQELKPAFNVNISSEKLMLYLFALLKLPC